MRAWLVGMLVLASVRVAAADVEGDIARTFPTYTLSSVNLAPSATGEDISGYDGQCTVQLVLTSGTIRVNVETSNLQQDGTPLGFVSTGTLAGSTMQDLTGGVQRVRLNVTCCQTDCTVNPGAGAGSCAAKAIVRCRRG
jgi:hypothetical protein